MNAPRVGGRFVLGELLGHGSFGQVFHARDTALDTDVAVKFVRGEASGPSSFFKEIALLRLLRLPGVVGQVADGVTGEGTPYLVTELVDGGHFPGRPVPAPWSAIEGSVVALLEALERVHSVGVTHRDLKPANVLVSVQGVPTLLDFGLARDAGDREPEEYLVGTPG